MQYGDNLRESADQLDGRSFPVQGDDVGFDFKATIAIPVLNIGGMRLPVGTEPPRRVSPGRWPDGVSGANDSGRGGGIRERDAPWPASEHVSLGTFRAGTCRRDQPKRRATSRDLIASALRVWSRLDQVDHRRELRGAPDPAAGGPPSPPIPAYSRPGRTDTRHADPHHTADAVIEGEPQ